MEIAKALSQNARVMVFDEPTAVLSVQDAQRLLAIIEGLRAKGVAIIYISHRLDEVLQISDRVTVLKDGASVTTLPTADLTIDEMIRLMVGRARSDLFGEDVARSPGDDRAAACHARCKRWRLTGGEDDHDDSDYRDPAQLRCP